jgi:hypothetical protein
VTDAQAFNEAMNGCVLRILLVFYVIPYFIIFKVDVCHTRGILARGRIRLAVRNTSSGKLLELHDILGERASFV